MTQGDILFLQRLVNARKQVIAEDCKIRKLNDRVLQSRLNRAEKSAAELLKQGGQRHAK